MSLLDTWDDGRRQLTPVEPVSNSDKPMKLMALVDVQDITDPQMIA